MYENVCNLEAEAILNLPQLSDIVFLFWNATIRTKYLMSQHVMQSKQAYV